MKKVSFWCAVASVLFTISCNSGKEQALQQQLDSIQTQYNQRIGDYEDLSGYIDIIAEGLDSISQQEGRLFQTNTDPSESPMLNRSKLKENFETLKNTLSSQRQRIDELEKQLANSQGVTAKLRRLVVVLKDQIAEKDAQIAKLSEEIENGQMSIDELKSSMLAMRQKNARQAELIGQQEELIKAQEDALNEGFVKMGTLEELKKLGLVTGGGLLSKKKVDYSKVESDLFDRINITDTHKIKVPGKKVKILTAVPEESYKIERTGKNSVIRILAPDRFWSISNYLIIQTD